MTIQQDIASIKEKIVGNLPPEHFGEKDLIRAFFGALLFGFTFSFNTALIDVSKRLTTVNLMMILTATIIILTAEIYFIGYSRVENKKERKFGQFWLKRLPAFYLVAIATTYALVYIYGLNSGLSPAEEVQLITSISLPCAIGASLADLLKQY